MFRWKSVAFGLCTMILGVLGALLFRQPGSPQATPSSGQHQSPNPERSLDITLQLAPIADTSPSWQPTPPSHSARPLDAAAPARVSLEGLQPPPDLPPIFESLASPPASARDADVQDSRPQLPSEKRHFLADGDTLHALAERYLGDPAKWQIIYRANSDILSSPDLLPIGVEIVIPTGAQLDSEAAAAVNAPHAVER